MWLLNCSILYFITLIVSPAVAYRILGIFPFESKSHFAMFGQLMKALAGRGHQVDVVSHFPLKKPIPNYQDVVSLPGIVPDWVNNLTIDMLHSMGLPGSEPELMATVWADEVCDIMSHPELKDLIINPPKNPAYDLVITEIFSANCHLAMGQHLKVPVVGLDSTPILPWANDFTANPDNEAYIPNIFSNFIGRMNFWQRLENTLINFKVKWNFYRLSERQNNAIKKYIGPHALSIRAAERNVSLILVNSHYSLHGARPFTMAVVEVGGLHIDERDATLPNDLQKWLDAGTDGVVYVSFGSMLKIESLPKETLVGLYASMAKLAPVRILMKIVNPKELPSGLPSNVFTRPWIPQVAVLKHNNIQAFVTHGGLFGTQEAIYFGVPMIGIPFFADQGQNVEFCSHMNIAVRLDLKKLTVETLDAAFNAVLRDPSYGKAVKRISALFRDRPISAMDTAVFWIEYVIRHGGTNLRSPAMDLAWWQIALLDVYGFFLSSVLLALCFLIIIVKKLKELFYHSNTKRKAESKKVR